MKIGDEVYVHGYIDEIRKDTVIIKNDGGYFGTVPSEIITELSINDFREYQKEWLTSHNDIEFDRPEEDLILAFLDDTADCYISEHTS